ncbi:histidinol dehydrogenase [Aliarcobacter cibarius]|jgi:histidinol dehydrogenase|uniref:Histidinol dehydrogenase n=1 Tax=Aliarcobacter cibarius TaxID=255507 RepID=A0A5J6RLH6_9BACT|nr:histidinol dehydrogenase [Aliarcobacter cibarius]QEZ89738.1 histidinal dehydrogenase / histidinol dehydrogenase [Aliarcobacter cibarius]QKJ27748.1 histidinal dehydrogenase / histidinol dehydrogenase [Aliarcobacter cibarius]TLT01100.1 histidinol dehydrogenase [Aliarcobacter cibarius]TLT01197.1 histidinol dehydrogenase [Aliarcobacter cibarius]TLT04992.1 histidinol dehydrogenase [Aliarcobacter cibarius]
MKIINTNQNSFKNDFETILQRAKSDIKGVSKIVENIIDEIVQDGNEALKRHIEKFDKWQVKNDDDLLIPQEDMKKAYDNLDLNLKKSLHTAFDRIKNYHEKQLPKSWIDFEDNGTILGQKVTPVDRAGLYIPGGKAAYPSSLLMNAIPALVAKVKEIIVCTPTPNNEVNELLLAACYLCKVSKVYKVGGASAIAAMAYGTKTIPKVDVITGPGNIFVATAKKMVFGEVNIDMIAGPSEIGVLADETANPRYVAFDLLSQAEHDEMASSILITTDDNLAKSVSVEVSNILKDLSRKDIAQKSIDERGAIIVASNITEAISLMNEIAPEHLEVMTKNPFELLPYIKHAGAIFLGENTPEPIGDYIAGPNHTLPTGSTAKFYSPLNVENFLKKSSIISFSKNAINELGEACALLADTEGLEAHAKSVRVRLENK